MCVCIYIIFLPLKGNAIYVALCFAWLQLGELPWHNLLLQELVGCTFQEEAAGLILQTGALSSVKSLFYLGSTNMGEEGTCTSQPIPGGHALTSCASHSSDGTAATGLLALAGMLG